MTDAIVNTLLTAGMAILYGVAAWLFRTLVRLDREVVVIQRRMDDRDTICQMHERTLRELTNNVNRSDRNICRLCDKAGLEYERRSD